LSARPGAVPDVAPGQPGVDQHDGRAAESEQPGMMRVGGDFQIKKSARKTPRPRRRCENAAAGKGGGRAEEKGLDQEQDRRA